MDAFAATQRGPNDDDDDDDDDDDEGKRSHRNTSPVPRAEIPRTLGIRPSFTL